MVCPFLVATYINETVDVPEIDRALLEVESSDGVGDIAGELLVAGEQLGRHDAPELALQLADELRVPLHPCSKSNILLSVTTSYIIVQAESDTYLKVFDLNVAVFILNVTAHQHYRVSDLI